MSKRREDPKRQKSGLSPHSEAGEHLAAAESADGEGATVEIRKNPFLLEREIEECGGERAPEMRAALAPIHAGVGKAAAQAACLIEVNSENRKGLDSGGRQVASVVFPRGGREPSQSRKAVMKRDTEGTGDVVVAGTGGAQGAGGVGDKGSVGAASEDTEGFEGGGDIGAGQAEVPVLTLSEDLDQTLIFQALEVSAGGGGSDVTNDGEFGSGAGAPVREAVEHAGAGGFADGGGDAGDGCIGMLADIHSLMVNEVFLQGNWHSASCERGHANHPPRNDGSDAGWSAARRAGKFLKRDGH